MSRSVFSFLIGIFIFVNGTSEFAYSSEGGSSNLAHLNDSKICEMAVNHMGRWAKKPYVKEAKRRRLICDEVLAEKKQLAEQAGQKAVSICDKATYSVQTPHSQKIYWAKGPAYKDAVEEARSQGLTCGVTEENSTQMSSSRTASSEKKVSSELTALKPNQRQDQQTNNYDNQAPLIGQIISKIEGKQGTVTGLVQDETGIAEVTVDGVNIQVQQNGSFKYQTFVPANGINLRFVATDLSGLSSEQFIVLERSPGSQTDAITFDRLNPLGKEVRKNDTAIALVIGIANYENTPAKAIYADSDALMFRDFASEKLGIPENRIKTMVNDKADEREVLLSVKSWLSRSVEKGQTDVYIFFAGHGLASENGEKMYLLPYDGAPELLDDTAIMRNRLFADIAKAGPRSVTVFFDTCYSGTTRGPDMLIASRPIAIRAKGSSIPDGFTLFTAAGGDQTAKPLEEAKHGMFSYFLMKGMEGDADSNGDNQITAGELHAYVERNVVQQSSGSQTPELQGDAERVVVRFQ